MRVCATEYREESIFCARAEILQYSAKTNSWQSLDCGLSRIDIYQTSEPQRYRIVAVSAEGGGIVLNMPVFRELKCTSLSQVFRQLTAMNYTYGLNFVRKEDALLFSNELDNAISLLADLSIAPAPLGCFKTRYAKLASLASVTGLHLSSPHLFFFSSCFCWLTQIFLLHLHRCRKK